MKLREILAGVFVAMILSSTANAGIPVETIRSFNDALQDDDPALIVQTAEALIAAALENPGDPQARDAAFEAGTQLCLRGACERAIAAAPLMTGPGSEEVSEALANLLVAYAEWSRNSDRKRGAALEKALKTVVPEQPTLLTVAAFDAFHAYRLKNGKVREIKVAADMAVSHYSPVWQVIPANWGMVELSSAATAFAEDRSAESLDRMVNLQIALYPYMLDKERLSPVIEDIYYQAGAWQGAIGAWLRSKGGKSSLGADAAHELGEAERRRLSAQYFVAREKPLPLCKGSITQAPSPVYPKGAIQLGYVGAVLVGFDIREGDLENIRILAAVPDKRFNDAVLDAMQKVKWEFSEEPSDSECVRSRSGPAGIIPFEFVIR